MSEHTPTPWKWLQEVELGSKPLIRRFPIYTDGGKFGHPAEAKTQADAEFIVLAANSHAELLATCETTLELIGNWPTPHGALSDSWIQMSLVTVQKITDALNAAIARGKGPQ